MAMSNITEWAGSEFGTCFLGDLRRTNRLVKIAEGLAENVGGSVSACCGRASAQLASRLFDRPEVNAESVLQCHVEQTSKRCADMDLVIAVQDTTFLDFTGRKDLDNELGPIGPSCASRGVLKHSVLAVSPGKSVMGLLGTDIWTRDPADYGTGKNRRKRLCAQKESRKWLDGLKKAESALPESQRILVVGDRESDVFALFAAPRRANTDILVRANQNRSIVDDEYCRMREAIEAAPALGKYTIEVPRQGSRRARKAELEIQARAITVKAPRHKTPDIADVTVMLHVVRVREVNAAEGVEPLEWILLTSLVVNNLADARGIVDFYGVRWVIEEFHRVLKSGCRVEKTQFETLDRLKPVIAVLSVVACRVLSLSKVVREKPDACASSVCSEVERVVMEKWMAMKGEKNPEIRTANEFVRAVAILGGFMGRKRDGQPGTKTLWQGLRRLHDLVQGYKLAASIAS